MASVALNKDPLAALGNGVRAKAGGREWPLPLASTAIAVAIEGGIAAVRTTRVFRNAEGKPIEATMTFPVPGDAVLTGLRATVDGRDLVAKAQASKAARQTYEDAVDSGKAAILHEEKLRGVHMLSLGNLAPGKEASVTVTFLVPLSFAGAVPSLRIPTTVGEVYGRSPLLPCDDLATDAVVLEADLAVTSDSGVPQVAGLGAASGRLALDRPIDILVPGWAPRPVEGRAADGRRVTVTVEPLPPGERNLDLTVLMDRSGSTGEVIEGDARRRRVWDAMVGGTAETFAADLRPGDRVRVTEFDNGFTEIGEALGVQAADLVRRVGEPRGGTEIGIPVIATAKSRRGDILLVTDGRSHSIDVQAIAGLGSRVSVVLVGSDALDAKVGHVAALTGGMTFVVAGDDVAAAVRAALASLRVPSGNPASSKAAGLPQETAVLRGGARVSLAWSVEETFGQCDDVGRLAAGLALPALSEAAATEVAVAHGLCTHLTSLVVVDEAGEAQEGIPLTRKVPLMESASAFRSPAPAMYSLAAGGAPVRSFMSASPERGVLRSARASLDAGRESLSLRVSKGMPVQARAASDDAGWGSFDALETSLDLGDAAGPDLPEEILAGKPARRPVQAPPAPPLVSSLSPATALDLRSVTRRVDWDRVASEVASKGVSAFEPDVRLVILRVAAMPEVVRLAKACNTTAEAVAIALLAYAAGESSRSAARAARRVIAASPTPEHREALAALGL